jgi:radical SAM protein with 4Fe4S-binding SPASM domain
LKKPLFGETLQKGAKLLFQGSFDMTFDHLPFHQHNMPFKKRINLLIQGMQLMKRSVNRAGIPPVLQIEPSSICNLHCLTCANGAEMIKRPAMLMPFNMYQSIIDQIKDDVFLVAFWSWGEPFMHNEAFRMIRYAKDNGLFVHSSTNGHFFDDREQARKLIESGLDSLIVAVDGIDQPTYEQYRKGGDLSRVIHSIKNIVAERASLGASRPTIILRFIVMKHNEHQVDKVRMFAEDLGVDGVTFRSAIVRRSGIGFEDILAPQSRCYDGLNPNGAKRLNNYCHRPYANLTIFSNGDVVLCENDYNASFKLGNVADESIRGILSSRKSKSLLKIFRENLDEFIFCRECEVRNYQYRTENIETFILKSELHEREKSH